MATLEELLTQAQQENRDGRIDDLRATLALAFKLSLEPVPDRPPLHLVPSC